MTTPTNRIALRVAALSCAAALLAACGQTHDLQGPPPAVGEAVRTEQYLNLKDARLSVSAGGETFSGTMSTSAWQNMLVHVLEVSGDQPRRVRIDVERDRTENSAVFMGMPQNETEEGLLQGKSVIGTLVGDQWRFALESGESSPEIAEGLKALTGSANINTRVLYPSKASVGQVWEVREDAGRLFGAGLDDAHGTARLEFLRIVSFQGERCAEIGVSLDLTGSTDIVGERLTVRMNLSGTTYRSLETFTDLRTTMNGELTLRGQMEEEGMTVNLTATGPVTISAASTRLR